MQNLTQRLASLGTPSLLLDLDRLDANIGRMATRAGELGVALRPHVKTPKAIEVVERLLQRNARGITTSTLAEAEVFFDAGIGDIFYAVALAPAKVARVAALIRRGADLTCLIDSVEAAEIVARRAQAEDVVVPIVVEIDVDGYRTGIGFGEAGFLSLARFLNDHPATRFRGIMSYGGDSYNCASAEAMRALAEAHRRALLQARGKLAAEGIRCEIVSFGSTPATLHADSMDGITECRCGIYAFQDLFQAGIGACRIDDIAVSVLASVIGKRPADNQLVIDAGGMALSKDRSTQGHPFDAGFGAVCRAEDCQPIGDLRVVKVSQEIGIVEKADGGPIDFDEFAIGTLVRILPNHADMTAAAYDGYDVLSSDSPEIARWRRYNGW